MDHRPGVNFTIILLQAFTSTDPKSAKKTDNLTVFFALLVSALINALSITLVKLIPEAPMVMVMVKW